jgi:hypothetical protein
MAPRQHVGSLQLQAMRCLKDLLGLVIQREKIRHLETLQLKPAEAARSVVRQYVYESLPAGLQSELLTQLIADHHLQCPQIIIHLLFTPRLQRFGFQLTQQAGCSDEGSSSSSNNSLLLVMTSERERLVRVSEDDLAACLATLDAEFSAAGAGNFALESFYMTDTSQDPDFQGDPINNMTNTNLSIG